MKLANKLGKNNKTGAIGEEIAARFMKNRGFSLLEQNYQKKWGEIDLIMQNGTDIHFIEVKTVSHETKSQLEQAKQQGFRPEEQLTADKYAKLARTIDTWLAKEKYTGSYQLDLITVRLVKAEKYSQVEYFPSINLT